MKRVRLKKKNFMIFILFLFCIGMFCYSLFHIVDWYFSNQKNKDTEKKLEQFIVISEEENEEKSTNYEVDFSSLKNENSDTVGYFKMSNPEISYVVVQGEDNSYYLKHNFFIHKR